LVRSVKPLVTFFSGPILAPHPVVENHTLHSRGLLFLGSDGFFDVMSKEDIFSQVKKAFAEYSSTGKRSNLKQSTSAITTIGTTDEGMDLEVIKSIVKNLSETLPQIAWEKYGPKDYVRDDITLIVVYV